MHGTVRPAKGEMGLTRGTIFEFAEVDEVAALRAFDAALADLGSYAIITKEQSRIDFAFMVGRFPLPRFMNRLLGRHATHVAFDIWFERDPRPLLSDVHSSSIEDARSFIGAVYRDLPDAELWSILRLPPVAA